MRALSAFVRREEAATAVEYAVMLAAIRLTAILAISALGQGAGGMWGNIRGDLNAHGF